MSKCRIAAKCNCNHKKDVTKCERYEPTMPVDKRYMPNLQEKVEGVVHVCLKQKKGLKRKMAQKRASKGPSYYSL